MEHFGAVFKLDLTEETRTQLQEEKTGYVYADKQSMCLNVCVTSNLVYSNLRAMCSG